MKHALFLAIFLSYYPSVLAMDYTPPAVVPEFLKRTNSDHEPMPAELNQSMADLHKTTSAHRIHDAQTITQKFTNEEGKEVVIEIKQDKLHESDQDHKTMQVKRSTLILSHGAVAAVMGLVGTGVTLAIKYGTCKQ